MADTEGYYRQIFDHLGFVCITVSPDLKIVSCNEQAVRQFSADGGQLEGRSFLDLVEPADRDATGVLLSSTIEQRVCGEMEVRYSRGEDARSIFVLIASPIVDAEGRVIGASISMRDISERKRLSRELAKARRMASLGKMAENVAHLFNNILGGMQTSIDYGLPSDSPRELRKTLRMLSQSIGRASRITQQLAAFAESENAQDQAVALTLIMAGFIEKLRGRCEKSGIQLAVNIREVPAAMFDGNRLTSVLGSITQNAFDAMSEGGTLSIEMGREGDEAVIRISDNGCGMAEETLEHLFEPFFTTKGGLGGEDMANIGLSMAAVHGLIGEMGGGIVVASKLGKGTQVSIRLPLSREPSTTSPPDAPR